MPKIDSNYRLIEVKHSNNCISVKHAFAFSIVHYKQSIIHVASLHFKNMYIFSVVPCAKCGRLNSFLCLSNFFYTFSSFTRIMACSHLNAAKHFEMNLAELRYSTNRICIFIISTLLNMCLKS